MKSIPRLCVFLMALTLLMPAGAIASRDIAADANPGSGDESVPALSASEDCSGADVQGLDGDVDDITGGNRMDGGCNGVPGGAESPPDFLNALWLQVEIWLSLLPPLGY